VKIKVSVPNGKNKRSEITVEVKEVGMFQPLEAQGRKSICALVDRKGWDSAWERLEELKVKVLYHKGRPVVNVEEVRVASRNWFKKHKGK
jgi:hypothetical protein